MHSAGKAHRYGFGTGDLMIPAACRFWQSRIVLCAPGVSGRSRNSLAGDALQDPVERVRQRARSAVLLEVLEHLLVQAAFGGEFAAELDEVGIPPRRQGGFGQAGEKRGEIGAALFFRR